jgi:ribosomal protein S18 acetylase RimI-like enzyme
VVRANVQPEELVYRRRFVVDPDQLQVFFLASDGQEWPEIDRVLAHSFTWITAHAGEELVGFANVAWDGGVHFFLLDPKVHPSLRHRGIGARLVREAVAACEGHGEWVHVDAQQPLMQDFYVEACGFVPTPAGLIHLT